MAVAQPATTEEASAPSVTNRVMTPAMVAAASERDDQRYDHGPALRRCPCGRLFAPRGRQKYHDAACRQRAYRARQARPTLVSGLAVIGTLTEHSVYSCSECGERYFGERWCQGCQRPCTRVGLAIECECGETHMLEDILAQFGIELTDGLIPPALRPRAVRRTGETNGATSLALLSGGRP